MGVKKRRQYTGPAELPIVGYCPNPKCGVGFNEVAWRHSYETDSRGFVPNNPYSCGVCGHEWTT